jgi:NAD(P)-dependent dehydrogenase (short-subunit alcohol dehydrogenase family)
MSNEPSLTPPKNRIGIVGLGLMGTAITQRLLEAGYEVLVWNRSKDKALPLTSAGAKWSECPLVECQRVIISLYSSDVVEEVLASWEKNLSKSQIIIDTTTGDPQAAVRFASALGKRECIYIEAPISGSSQQTRQGLATVIAAGDRTAFDACNDLWPLLGKNTFYVGASGATSSWVSTARLLPKVSRLQRRSTSICKVRWRFSKAVVLILNRWIPKGPKWSRGITVSKPDCLSTSKMSV